MAKLQSQVSTAAAGGVLSIDTCTGNLTLGNGLQSTQATNGALSVKVKANDYVTVDANGLQLDGNKIDSTYITSGTVNTSTNLATVATVTAALGTLDVNEFALASVSSNVVTIKGIKEVDGKIAVGDGAGISLEEVAYTGAASDVSYTNTTSGLTATTVQAAIDEVAAKGIQTITGEAATTQGDYINVKVTATKGANDNNYTLSTSSNVTTHTVSDAVASSADGLALASDVKSYVSTNYEAKFTDGSHDVSTASAIENPAAGEATYKLELHDGTQTNGALGTDSTVADTLYFTQAYSSSNPIVTKADIGSLTGAMHFKDTVDGNNPLPTTGQVAGDVYIVAEAGTYASQACEVGDMIIWNGTSWTVVTGENQVTPVQGGAELVAGAAATTIGTVDGVSLTAKTTVTAGNATIASLSGNTVTLKSGVTQGTGTGTIANDSGSDITLADVAKTGAAADVSIADAGSLITAANVEGALQEIAGKSNTALQSISHGTDGNYVTTTIGTKTNNDQSVGVAVTVQAVSSADSTHMGLAEASDVKSYVDGKVNDLDSVADADDTTAQTGHATITTTTPNADFKVLNSVTETAGKLVSGEAYNLKKVAATGAAADLSYDNTTSQMTATTTQGAIDEINAWELILDCGTATTVTHTQA